MPLALYLFLLLCPMKTNSTVGAVSNFGKCAAKSKEQSTAESDEIAQRFNSTLRRWQLDVYK